MQSFQHCVGNKPVFNQTGSLLSGIGEDDTPTSSNRARYTRPQSVPPLPSITPLVALPSSPPSYEAHFQLDEEDFHPPSPETTTSGTDSTTTPAQDSELYGDLLKLREHEVPLDVEKTVIEVNRMLQDDAELFLTRQKDPLYPFPSM